MNYTINYDDKLNTKDILSEMVMGAVLLCLYSGGVYFHVKIIQVSRKEKELTWKIDISNSIFLMIHFFHTIFIYSLTNIVSNLHTYTGKWFCYFSKFLTAIGSSNSTGHSFVISLLKYVIIVRYQSTVTDVTKEKLKTIFFWVNILYPFVVFGIFNIIEPDFMFIYDGFSTANRCLGKSEVHSNLKNNASAIKLHNICILLDPQDPGLLEYMIFIIRKTICWVHVIFIYVNIWNLIECIIYIRIFRFMHRKIAPPNSKNAVSSETSKAINLRKLRVNVQVTAMVSILEASSNIGYVVIRAVIVRGNFTTLLQMVMLYMIILPYAFLMNTSDNKNRVVEHGWKNIVMNVIGRSNPSSVAPLNNNLDNITISKNSDLAKKPRSNPEKKVCARSNDGSKQTVKQINITPQSQEKLKLPEDPDQGSSGCSSLILNANTLKRKDKKQALALRLIQKLNDEKNDEKKYIEYFKRLLSYEGSRNEKTSIEIDEEEYEIFDLPNDSLKAIPKIAKSKNHKTKTLSKTKKSKNRVHASTEHYVNNENPGYKNENKLAHQDNYRTFMRTEIINKLLSCYKKDAYYDSLINQLIDQEESFCNDSEQQYNLPIDRKLRDFKQLEN